ncbi:MAG TPA: hypothetical protein VGC57_09375 [Cellulomonas sp.]
MTEHGLFEVDTDDLRRAGNALLRVADLVERASRRPSVPGRAGWAAAPLTAAAGRFEARYAHLLDGLAAEVDRSGEELKGTAFAYDEADAIAERRMRDLAAR